MIRPTPVKVRVCREEVERGDEPNDNFGRRAATAALLVTGCAHNQPPQGQSGPTTAEVSSASQADPAQPADVNGNGKPDGDPSDGDWPGKMTVVYEDATTPRR